tara:strand:- start:426 stop:734 length:309 start_codon:yes stop_codon:yes gene_type:complete
MCDFKKLEFTIVRYYPQQEVRDHRQATMFFDNGFGISVITGGPSYSNSDDEYEIAVLRKKGDSFELEYDTPITDGVVGHLSANEVSEYMGLISDLEPRNQNV